jgi:hypothetical protein
MTVTQKKVKSCCGSTTFIYEMDKPIKKSHLSVFENQGYSCPRNFQLTGVFYVALGSLICTTSYGSTRINARCYGANCQQMLNNFAITLEAAINS